MNQLTGRIENLTARSGLRASLEIQITVSNSNDSPIEIHWISARTAIAFFDMATQPNSAEQPRDLGMAFPTYNLPSISAGGRNNLTLALPVDAALIAEMEDERNERDVMLHLYVSYSGVTRSRDSAMGAPSNGMLADEKFSGQSVVFVIPRSLWQQIIQRFSIPSLYALKDLSRTITETRAAKTEAELGRKSRRRGSQSREKCCNANRSYGFGTSISRRSKNSKKSRLDLGIAMYLHRCWNSL